jgi:4'-phosphopantetheinyl transferase
MTHAAARDRYVRSQAGLRRILALYLELPPGSIEYCYGAAGKPGLSGACAWLEFSLTTTGDLALVGVSRRLALGVDCEWIRPRRDLDGIARRMFGPAQAQVLAATPGPERLAAFCHAWTALEADAKWDGRGLFRQRPAGAPGPQIRHLIPEAGYVAAVAGSILPPFEHWATLELLG